MIRKRFHTDKSVRTSSTHQGPFVPPHRSSILTHPQGSPNVIEKPDLTIGIIPLTDCAPLAVAVERGFFTARGLHVTTSREGSWAGIRDKLAYGVLDAAQMIAPMTLATTLGIGGVEKELMTAINLDCGGNAITLSNRILDKMARPHDAASLKTLIDKRAAAGAPPLTFGTVFPVSTHSYELRYWMAAAGIDPDRDVKLIVLPPPQMVDAMADGRIDGFCVGEPWNSVAFAESVGKIVVTKHELWNNSPEKVLGVTRQWAEKNPNTHQALIVALIEACRWIDDPDHPENRTETADILSLPQYVGIDPILIRPALVDRPGFFSFHRNATNFPWRSHAVWFLTQMMRWGHIETELDAAEITRIATAVYRPDLYRQAAKSLDLPTPDDGTDYKSEGEHDLAWELPTTSGPIAMGSDRFIDGRVFEPANPSPWMTPPIPDAFGQTKP